MHIKKKPMEILVQLWGQIIIQNFLLVLLQKEIKKPKF